MVRQELRDCKGATGATGHKVPPELGNTGATGAVERWRRWCNRSGPTGNMTAQVQQGQGAAPGTRCNWTG
ncbi:MAG: hypothetical protein U0T72_01050 [Chitinophagales bacterium]